MGVYLALIHLNFSRINRYIVNLKLVSQRKFGQVIQRNVTLFRHLDGSVLLYAIRLGGGLAAVAL
jgi:hypothetical protein